MRAVALGVVVQFQKLDSRKDMCFFDSNAVPCGSAANHGREGQKNSSETHDEQLG